LLAMVAVGACSSSTSSPTPTPTPTASPSPSANACTDIAAFKAALTALTAVDLSTGGTDALKAALDQVTTAATAMQSSVGAALAPEVTALVTALGGLKTAVGNVGSGPIASNAPGGRRVAGRRGLGLEAVARKAHDRLPELIPGRPVAASAAISRA